MDHNKNQVLHLKEELHLGFMLFMIGRVTRGIQIFDCL